MKFSLRSQNLTQLLKQRDFARIIAFGLVLSNGLLALKLLNMEEKWVLIPQFDITRQASLTHSSFSDQYLIEWADGVIRDLLTVSPITIDHKIKRILEISTSNSNAFKSVLREKARKIKEESISTVFYPKTYQVFQNRQEVVIRGVFSSFFGHDKTPVQKEKWFLLRFTRGTHGVILIDHFEEIKK